MMRIGTKVRIFCSRKERNAAPAVDVVVDDDDYASTLFFLLLPPLSTHDTSTEPSKRFNKKLYPKGKTFH